MDINMMLPFVIKDVFQTVPTNDALHDLIEGIPFSRILEEEFSLTLSDVGRGGFCPWYIFVYILLYVCR